MKDRIVITVGRQNGSGGREIGKELAKSLNINCYDNELLLQTAKKYNLKLDYVEKNDEIVPSNIASFGGQNVPSELFEEESNLIKEIASKESCIFIGRCSDFVLRENDNIINIFLHAPMESRVQRVENLNNIDKDEAEKLIKSKDRKRASYYNFYTNQIWGDAKNYDLSLDTSKLGVEGSVKFILQYLNAISAKI